MIETKRNAMSVADFQSEVGWESDARRTGGCDSLQWEGWNVAGCIRTGGVAGRVVSNRLSNLRY